MLIKWTEKRNHVDDCYFYVTDVKGMDRYKKRSWVYPNIQSTTLPTLHSKNLPIPIFTVLSDVHFDDIEMLDAQSESNNESDFEGCSHPQIRAFLRAS